MASLPAAVLLATTLLVYCLLALLKHPGAAISARALAIDIFHSASVPQPPLLYALP